jgi:acetyl esterase/lipase
MSATVFAINHRGTPRFHFSDPVEDLQRAIRTVCGRPSGERRMPGSISAGGNATAMNARVARRAETRRVEYALFCVLDPGSAMAVTS